MTRKKSHWGDEERAAAGREHRDRVKTNPLGVTVTAAPEAEAPDADSDGTPEAELPADAELTAPTERVMNDPVALEIWKHVENVARRGVRRHRDTGNRIAEVHADAGNHHIGARIARLEAWNRRLIAVAMAALTTAGGSLVAVGKGLFERGEKEGRAEIRLDHVEQSAEQIRLDLRELRDRLERRRYDLPGWFPAQPAQKGSTP